MTSRLPNFSFCTIAPSTSAWCNNFNLSIWFASAPIQHFPLPLHRETPQRIPFVSEHPIYSTNTPPPLPQVLFLRSFIKRTKPPFDSAINVRSIRFLSQYFPTKALSQVSIVRALTPCRSLRIKNWGVNPNHFNIATHWEQLLKMLFVRHLHNEQTTSSTKG